MVSREQTAGLTMGDAAAICLQISNGIAQQVGDLATVWAYVGYDVVEREKKLAALLKVCRSAVAEFIERENAAVNELNSKMEVRRQEVAAECRSLNLPPYLPSLGLTTCQLLKDLSEKMSELTQEKQRRLDEYNRLCREIILSSLQLGRSPESIKDAINGDRPIQASTVPSEELLGCLQSTLDENTATLGPLISQLNSLQADIRRIAQEISYQPKTDRERAAIILLEHAETDEGAAENGHEANVTDRNGFIDLDAEILRAQTEIRGALPNEADLEELQEMRLRLVKEKARLVGTCEELRSFLQSLWGRLDKPVEEQEAFLKRAAGFNPHSLQILETEAAACRQERLQTIKAYLPVVKAELFDLARTCCLEDQEINKVIRLEAACSPDGGTELVDYIESRIEELKIVFRKNRRVYQAIAAFQSSFGALQDIEQRLKDPTILSNRGGVLLKTEKEKKRLLKEVDKAEKEALGAIDEYENEKSQPFLLSNGKTFVQAVEEQRRLLYSSGGRSRASSAAGRRSIAGGHPGSPC